MGHFGKHIIDPETGLCEICDRGAINEVRQGKRPGKQIYYSNHDDRLTHRSHPDEMYYGKDQYPYDVDDEPTPRYVRKSVYPAPTVRSRRVVYEQPIEEPVLVRRKIVRRERSPPEDVVVHHPVRPTTFYYVDEEGQMVPRNSTPPPEPPRRYIVQNRQPPPPRQPPPQPTRSVRVIHQRAQTPPPPVSEAWRSGPRRQINSDTEILERQQRIRHNDPYDQQPPTPRKPEMFHIEMPNNPRRSPLVSPIPMSYDHNTPPPKMMYQGERNRRPPPRLEPVTRRNQIEPEPVPRRNHREPQPVTRKNHHEPEPEPEPTVVRRVYKKLPPGKYDTPKDEYIPNENHQRPVRRNGQNQPPSRLYQSSPQLTYGNNGSPIPAKNPSIYYIRSVDDY